MSHSISPAHNLQLPGSVFPQVVTSGPPQAIIWDYPADFLESTETPDKAGVYLYSLTTYTPAAQARTTDFVEALHGLVLDFDQLTPETAEAIVGRWAEYDCVVHTSHSHMRVTSNPKHRTAAPCLRIILPYSRPATFEEHVATWAWAEDQSRPITQLDKNCKDAVHMFYLPAHAPGAEHYALRSASPTRLTPRPGGPPRKQAPPAKLEDWMDVTTDTVGQGKLREAVEAAEVVDQATGEDRHTHTYMLGWPVVLGGYVAGRHLAVQDVIDALVPYAERWPGERFDTITSGLVKGIRKGPLPAPEVSLATAMRVHAAKTAVKAAKGGTPDAQEAALDELAQAEAGAAAEERARKAEQRHRLDEAAGVELQRDGNLRAESSFENVTRLLGAYAEGDLWWDEFKNESVLEGRPVDEEAELQIEKLLGGDLFRMKFSSPEVIRRGIRHTAMQTKRHPIKEYLEGLAPPTVPVLDQLALRGFCGSFRDEAEARYASRLARRWMISAVARIYDPGCQADSMIVLQGDQGVQKSSVIKELVGGDRWFNAQELDMDDMKRVVIHLPAYWVHEMAEMRDAKDVKAQKAFISLRSDTGIGMYGRTNQDRPRHSVFFGTVNPPIFLVDPTGNRRFWVLHTNEVDLGWVREHRDALWAEACAAHKAGEPHWLTDEEEDEVAWRNLEYTAEVPVELAVAEVVGSAPQKTWRVLELLPKVLDKMGLGSRATTTAVGLALKKGGWEKKQRASGNAWAWSGQGSMPPRTAPGPVSKAVVSLFNQEH